MNKKLVALLVVAVALSSFIYGAGFTIVEKPVEKDYGPWVGWERGKTTACVEVGDGWLSTSNFTSSTANRMSITLFEVRDLTDQKAREAFTKSGILPDADKAVDAWVEMDGERIDFPVVINPGETFSVKVPLSAADKARAGAWHLTFVVVNKLERPVPPVIGDSEQIVITAQMW